MASPDPLSQRTLILTPTGRDAQIARPPDMVFLNVNLEVQEAIQTIEMLSKAGFAGAVQLMSSRGSAVLDTVKQAGEQFKLRMLPVLKKPFIGPL